MLVCSPQLVGRSTSNSCQMWSVDPAGLANHSFAGPLSSHAARLSTLPDYFYAWTIYPDRLLSRRSHQMVPLVESMEGRATYCSLLSDGTGPLHAIAGCGGNGAGHDSRQLSGYETFL